MEISDHQLCDMYEFKTNVSVLTNIYDVHTDFHDSHEKYVMTKKKIFNNHTSDDIAIINLDNKDSMEYNDKINNTYSKQNDELNSMRDAIRKKYEAERIKLREECDKKIAALENMCNMALA